MIDFVQPLMCACDLANAITMQGGYLKVPATNLGAVTFFVKGVPDGWCVQSAFEAELSLFFSVWDLDGQRSSADCGKPLLVGRVEEHQ